MITETTTAELAARGLRIAADHEAGWYVQTTGGMVWATDEAVVIAAKSIEYDDVCGDWTVEVSGEYVGSRSTPAEAERLADATAYQQLADNRPDPKAAASAAYLDACRESQDMTLFEAGPYCQPSWKAALAAGATQAELIAAYNAAFGTNLEPLREALSPAQQAGEAIIARLEESVAAAERALYPDCGDHVGYIEACLALTWHNDETGGDGRMVKCRECGEYEVAI